jgi:hypothetical protein
VQEDAKLEASVNLRQQLRAWALLPLLVQSAWLFALVPADCCAEHRPAAMPSCHEEQTHSSDGECVMRGQCDGPMTALLSLLSAQAVLTPPPQTWSNASASLSFLAPPEQLLKRFIPPDSPPPRA